MKLDVTLCTIYFIYNLDMQLHILLMLFYLLNWWCYRLRISLFLITFLFDADDATLVEICSIFMLTNFCSFLLLKRLTEKYNQSIILNSKFSFIVKTLSLIKNCFMFFDTLMFIYHIDISYELIKLNNNFLYFDLSCKYFFSCTIKLPKRNTENRQNHFSNYRSV